MYSVEAITPEGNRAWLIETKEFGTARDMAIQAASEHQDWAIIFKTESYEIVMYKGKIYEDVL